MKIKNFHFQGFFTNVVQSSLIPTQLWGWTCGILLLVLIGISCGGSPSSENQALTAPSENSPVRLEESTFYMEGNNIFIKGESLSLKCTFNLDYIKKSKTEDLSNTPAMVAYFYDHSWLARGENGKAVVIATSDLNPSFPLI